MSENPKPVGKLKPVDIKPVGKLTPVNSTVSGFNKDAVMVTPEMKIDQIAETLPDFGEGDTEYKKQVFKELALKGATKEQLSDAYLTMSGKHPLQEGNDKYYYDKKGMPVPLKSGERPPQGYDVANDYWGTQEEANNDSFLTSAGKHIYNGVLKGVEGIEGLANLPYALATGNDAEWYKNAQNRIESSLFKTPEYEKEGVFFNPIGIKSVGDFFDPERYDFSKNTIQGAALQGLESVASFLTGTKGIGAAGKLVGSAAEGAELISEGGKLSNILQGAGNTAQKLHAFGGAYAISMPEILDYMDKNGVQGREKYALASAIAVPFALTEMLFGTEGLMVKNQAARDAKKAVIKGIVDGVTKNADGTISKEFIEKAFEATTKEAAKLNKSLIREVGENVVEEAATEGIQEFEKVGLSELYDRISKEDNFKKDPLSLNAFGDYYNSMLSGAAGAMGPGTSATIQKRKQDLQEKQSANIYNIVSKGESEALKKNVVKAQAEGEITKEQAEATLFKIDSYNMFNEQSKGLNLNDESKKRLFELTFQKQNLEDQIPSDYEESKMNGIEQGQINAKKKQAKELQNEIDKIIHDSTVKEGRETTAQKTQDEITKDEQAKAKDVTKAETEIIQDDAVADEKPAKKNEEGKVEYEVPQYVKDEKRNYNEIPKDEWNDPSFFAQTKQHKLAQYINQQKDKFVEGKIVVDNEYKDATGHDVQTFGIMLPDGKMIRFASSMKRRPSKEAAGGYRGFTYEENFSDRDNPIGADVGLKVVKLKDSGRKVIFIYNNEQGPKRGKHIGMVKETLRGKSIYSEHDIEEMKHLQMTDMSSGGEQTEVKPEKPTPKGPADVKIVQPKIVLEQPTRENFRKRFIEDRIQKLKDKGYYDPSLHKIYEASANKQFEFLNPLYGKETAGETTVEAGTTQEAESKNTGSSNEVKVKKQGTKRLNQKVKDPVRKKAMKIEVFSPYHLAMQHFIGGGFIDRKSVEDLYGGDPSEANKRSHMVLSKIKYANTNKIPTIDELAHNLWESNKDKNNAETEDYKNAIEEVIQKYLSPVPMAHDLIEAFDESITPNEELVSELYEQAEENDVVDEVNKITDALENESDEALNKIADDQKAFDKWEEDTDIENYEGDVPFQKQSNLKGDISKIVETLQKAMPKIKVVYDENLVDNEGKPVAGKLVKDTITINPHRTGTDTPIHEYGHVFIDSIGYNNPKIQAAIKQLQNTPLWKEIADRYPELNEEMLAKEVLAEAIGREGAGVFDKVSEQNKFLQFLDYLYAWLKAKLGLDKNIAKSLAKQIISGIGTKEMVGTNETEQLQKAKPLPKKVLAKTEKYKDLSIEDLQFRINELNEAGEAKGDDYKALQIQLGYKIGEKQREVLRTSEKFVDDIANKIDLSKKDVLFKNLSHMTEAVPELQAFETEFENAEFDKTAEQYELNNELERLAKAVVKEKNKQLGLKERIGQLFTSDSAKYFDFVEKDGEYVSGEGLTKAQKDFLDFMKKLQKLRNEQYLESGNTGEIDDIIKVDEGAKEAFKTHGIVAAFSAYLGNSFALKSADIDFKDPQTGKRQVIPYSEVEKRLIEYGKEGPVQKANALRLLLKYNFKARRNTGDKIGQYNISPTGQLNNKFLKPRDKDRGYSKDFYKAAQMFISDYTHTKHLSKLTPLIDSIELLNKYGFGEQMAKPNVVKWIQDWKDLHLFKNEKQGQLGPEVDALLRTLRKATSLAVMSFNIPAAGWNLATGIYNNIRNESFALQKKGTERLFLGLDRSKFKGYNKKAANIIEKYQAVASDYNSNPKLTGGKIWDKLAHGLTREAEYVIQGSMFLGQLTDEEWNAFDDEGNLKYRSKEKAIKQKMIKYKNRVSDIQGKYNQKDVRNYMLTEFGKSASQFKNWLPDALRIRFGDKYLTTELDEKGNKVVVEKGGTFRGPIKELYDSFKQEGPKAIWNNKNAMANLKGAMTVAALLSIQLGGDDDEKNRRKGDVIDKALGNVLMIFDPQSLKFTLTNPVASIGTLTRFADALNHGLHGEGEKAVKDVFKTLPYNKAITKVPELFDNE
nr:hypothetical protein [uncultured Flavobacterium sp.]